MTSTVRLIEVALPDFGVPEIRPGLSRDIYAARFAHFADRVHALGLDAAVVYADREHFANLAYLTGFDPRFEEALMVFVAGRDPVVLTGPENQGTARLALQEGRRAPRVSPEASPRTGSGPTGIEVDVDVRLYPPFGLLGQDRRGTPPLIDLLAASGLSAGARIGAIGWKYFGRDEATDPEGWIDIPAYLADALRAVAGPAGRLVNATAIFMDASTGLRALNEIDQLAEFEFAATHASEAVKRVVFGVRSGMSEYEAVRLMQIAGMPQSAHLMLSAGARAHLGLGSPSDRVIGRGEPFSVAVGLWGGLTCRAGFLVAEASELDAGIRDYVERLAAPYFACAAEWYETVGIGVTGGELDLLVKRRLGDPFFHVALNPGHLIHLDEWLNTPIYPGSGERLQSGQAIQVDIIPATGTAYFTSNIEDGIALLDEAGRHDFANRFPDAWQRIQARRAFMADVLGIRLKPEVLPFSNLAGYLSPFLLSPGQALAKEQ